MMPSEWIDSSNNFIPIQHNNQQHLRNLLSLVGAWGYIFSSSDILIPTVCSEIYPFSISFKIFSLSKLKAPYTFLYSFALISMKFNPYFLAKLLPSSTETWRSIYRSVLFPISNTCIDAFPFAFTSSSHSWRCSKVSFLYYSKSTE